MNGMDQPTDLRGISKTWGCDARELQHAIHLRKRHAYREFDRMLGLGCMNFQGFNTGKFSIELHQLAIRMRGRYAGHLLIEVKCSYYPSFTENTYCKVRGSKKYAWIMSRYRYWYESGVDFRSAKYTAPRKPIAGSHQIPFLREMRDPAHAIDLDVVLKAGRASASLREIKEAYLRANEALILSLGDYDGSEE